LRGLEPAENAGNYELYGLLFSALLENAGSLRDWDALIKTIIVYMASLQRINQNARKHFTKMFVRLLNSVVAWSNRKQVENQLNIMATMSAVVAKESGELTRNFHFHF
jgi:hypothetical protein